MIHISPSNCTETNGYLRNEISKKNQSAEIFFGCYFDLPFIQEGVTGPLKR